MKTKSFFDELYKTQVYAVWGTRDDLDKWLHRKFNQYVDDFKERQDEVLSNTRRGS